MRWRRFVRATLVYLALSCFWVYGILDRGLYEGGSPYAWLVLAGIAVAHVAFGFVVREWVALLLPIAVIFLAIPAGYPISEFGESLPLYLGQVFLVQVEIPLIALGLGLRALAEKRRPRPGSRSALR